MLSQPTCRLWELRSDSSENRLRRRARTAAAEADGGCTETTAADHADHAFARCPRGARAVVRLRAAGQLRSHAVKRSVGVGADGLNGNQAHDDNQRQHDGVLDRGRAIFRDQETLHLQSESLHCLLQTLRLPTWQPAIHQRLSPPGTATRTSRRPALHRVETQTSNARLVIVARLSRQSRTQKNQETRSTLSAARLPPATCAAVGPIALRPGIATGLPFRGCEAAGLWLANARNAKSVGGSPPDVERRETCQPDRSTGREAATPIE